MYLSKVSCQYKERLLFTEFQNGVKDYTVVRMGGSSECVAGSRKSVELSAVRFPARSGATREVSAGEHGANRSGSRMGPLVRRNTASPSWGTSYPGLGSTQFASRRQSRFAGMGHFKITIQGS